MKTYRLSSDGALATNSSGGKLLKWEVDNKFIKTSTFDTTQLRPQFLYESYAEYIVSRIANYLGLDAIPYRLCRVIIDGKYDTIACESTNFLKSNEHYVSIGKMMKNGDIPFWDYGDNSTFYKLLAIFNKVEGFKENINQMILLDSLVLNSDRHYGNFGIIVNGKVRPAPLFDHGNSLFCNKHTTGIDYGTDLITPQIIQCKPFSIFFDEQLELISGYAIDFKDLDNQINKIVDYTVNTYGLPKDRGTFIKDLLKDRLNTVKKIL